MKNIYISYYNDYLKLLEKTSTLTDELENFSNLFREKMAKNDDSTYYKDINKLCELNQKLTTSSFLLFETALKIPSTSEHFNNEQIKKLKEYQAVLRRASKLIKDVENVDLVVRSIIEK